MFSLPQGSWCWEHGGSTLSFDRAATGTVNGCTPQMMAKGLHAGVAQHGQPDFAVSRAGYRTPGGTLGTMDHTCPCLSV